ncbi:MAG: transketolase [Synergistes sp.]|nr:transketolase [Synergistes sp.]
MRYDMFPSALSAFCSVISERTAAGADFLFVAEEKTAEKELKTILPLSAGNVFSSVESAVMSAAGLAIAGKRPWLIGRASDLAGRAYAHIREVIARTGLPVRIVAFDGGISCEHEGASVQMLEDTALMRAMPCMNVLVPSDRETIADITADSDGITSPFYMRLDSSAIPAKYDDSSEPFHIGGARIVREGSCVTICTCGAMLGRALWAAEKLEIQNISAEVIDCYSIKPFAENVLLSSVRRTGCCVTAAEESASGGLFSAVAECLGRTYPVPLRSVSVGGGFVDSGAYDELCEYYGLTSKEIVDAAAQVWALRRR